jgi:hypothetical protein
MQLRTSLTQLRSRSRSAVAQLQFAALITISLTIVACDRSSSAGEESAIANTDFSSLDEPCLIVVVADDIDWTESGAEIQRLLSPLDANDWSKLDQGCQLVLSFPEKTALTVVKQKVQHLRGSGYSKPITVIEQP